MLKKAAALLLVFVSVSPWVGCGKLASAYVYASVPTSSQIAVYREDPNSGVLTALSGSPFPAGPGVYTLVISPSKQYMYGANSQQGNISTFTIASNGLLTESGSRTTVIGTPLYLLMDPSGNYLYVGCDGPSSISVFSIGSGGALTQVGSPLEIGIPPLSMALTPSGSFLYVTGTTSASAPGVVQAFSVTAGVLTPILGSPFSTGKSPQGIAITPNGHFLYIANTVDNTISEFSIDATAGTLTELVGSPIEQSSTYSGPLALLVENSGNYLYVANKASGNLAAYSISNGSNGASGGGLQILPNSPFGAGGNPVILGIDPSGGFLFSGTQGGQVQSFLLNSSSGELVSVQNYTVGSGNPPGSIVVLH